MLEAALVLWRFPNSCDHRWRYASKDFKGNPLLVSCIQLNVIWSMNEMHMVDFVVVVEFSVRFVRLSYVREIPVSCSLNHEFNLGKSNLITDAVADVSIRDRDLISSRHYNRTSY